MRTHSLLYIALYCTVLLFALLESYINAIHGHCRLASSVLHTVIAELCTSAPRD
jgi:hypothetical protein